MAVKSQLPHLSGRLRIQTQNIKDSSHQARTQNPEHQESKPVHILGTLCLPGNEGAPQTFFPAVPSCGPSFLPALGECREGLRLGGWTCRRCSGMWETHRAMISRPSLSLSGTFPGYRCFCSCVTFILVFLTPKASSQAQPAPSQVGSCSGPGAQEWPRKSQVCPRPPPRTHTKRWPWDIPTSRLPASAPVPCLFITSSFCNQLTLQRGMKTSLCLRTRL